MAFKGLEDRFKEKASQVYNRYSTKDGSSLHPLMEWKPNDPNAQEQKHDSRTVPVGAVKRDLARIGKYSISGQGGSFLVKQGVLQFGNTFSETRLINPVFVMGNVVPYLHLRRSLNAPSSYAVKGDTSKKSPASDSKVGSAGRLQVKTSENSVSNLMGQGGKNNIISLLPSSNIIDAVKGAFSVNDNGSLGVNQRPEIDFDGGLYSVALWKGFKKQHGFRDNLDSAAANLRVGNIDGAVKSVKNAISNVQNQISQLGLIPSSDVIADGRDNITTSQDGRRYFIKNEYEADRYLKNSIVFTTTAEGFGHSTSRLSFLNRQPYILKETKDSSTRNSDSFGKIHEHANNVDGLKQASFSSFKSAPSSVGFNNTEQIKNAIQSYTNFADDTNVSVENPAESAMLFNERSLRNRYNTDERLSFIRNQLQTQINSQKEYWRANQPNLAFDDIGLKPGSDININPKNKFGKRGIFKDNMNIYADVHPVKGDEPSPSDIIAMQKATGGADLINVWFFDYARKEIIPFRAYVSALNESTNVEITDTRYIGRVERNIVYTGATRDVSFQMKLYAMSEAELRSIWHKLEHLTGLCFPGSFSRGFMVPPLVKITLGNIFYNQPCYIKSISNSIEDDVSWETENGVQVPHGITSSVTLSIIEKTQKKSGSHFYDLTERTTIV